MTDGLKHECGIAMIRLLKPLEYYHEKYGTWMYGLQKLYLLMEKQHNRGQDGAGVVSVKLDVEAGAKYLHRCRSNGNSPIKEVFEEIYNPIVNCGSENKHLVQDVEWAKKNIPFAGELYLGHLRYGTFGNNSIDYVHPVMRESNWKSRNLVLAGNFNMTNVDELFKSLIALGQHPKDYSDTVTCLEKVGFHLDEENQFLFRKYKNEGYSNREISDLLAKTLDIKKVLHDASSDWDGGYAMAGLIGHGDAFVTRDPWGIRPAFYYHDDEIVVVASERPVIQTVLNIEADKIKEVAPGSALIIKKNGNISNVMVRVPGERKSCSFERIYFSRGSDQDIYNERKMLGSSLVPKILDSINHDLENTVFSFIPNTAETAFYGMVQGVEDYIDGWRKKAILEDKNITKESLDKIFMTRPRVEKIAIKDIKLRTFISQDSGRDDLVGHVYDITYNSIIPNKDSLVVIDDSIVRGTTLKRSILRILDRLKPKKIVIVSSSPQIRYPDCYGIDMARLGDFIAFKAAIELLKDNGKEDLIQEVYKKAKAQQNLPKEEMVNYVKEIYRPFTADQISAKIGDLLKPDDLNAEVEILYQSIEGLHLACPNDKGDWYFTGDYPTPGGNKVVNTSFINYVEGITTRAY